MAYVQLEAWTTCILALTDNEAAVVCDAVRCMAAVAKHLRKRSLLAAARKVRILFTDAPHPACSVQGIVFKSSLKSSMEALVTPLLRHPSPAVRYAAITFSASAASLQLRHHVCAKGKSKCDAEQPGHTLLASKANNSAFKSSCSTAALRQ
eukprot:scaffold291611_cov21-Tisochrysis_lutea.AAC.2